MKSNMETMQPVTLYVVTAETWEEHKDNSEDRVEANYGVLRIFSKKDDALAYMRKYYDNIKPNSKSVNIYENSDGGFRVKIKAWVENVVKGAVSLSGHRLDDRLHNEVLKCREIEVTDTFDVEKMTMEDDLFAEFYG